MTAVQILALCIAASRESSSELANMLQMSFAYCVYPWCAWRHVNRIIASVVEVGGESQLSSNKMVSLGMLSFGIGTLRWIGCNIFEPKKFLDSLFLGASSTSLASDASLGLFSVTARQ